MRLKRPRPASADQVWITREGETVVIEYADRGNAPLMRGSCIGEGVTWLGTATATH